MSIKANQKEILTAREAAKHLRVSEVTLIRWLKKGKIPAFKLEKSWRIREQDLSKFLNTRINEHLELIKQKNEQFK